jgi:hypothetical protein
MLSVLFASVTDTTVPAGDYAPARPTTVGSTVADVISTVIDNLGNNVTDRLALVIATAAIVAMLNVGVHRLVLVPVGIGAFWAGWLGWNVHRPGPTHCSRRRQRHQAVDVAFTSDSGFLIGGCRLRGGDHAVA